MAQHKSAKKRILRNDKRKEINLIRRGRIRTHVKAVEAAIEAGDKSVAADALKAAQPEIQRGVIRGLWHRNTASRKISRLSARIKTLA
jgi:small subunit ribosomal protein S20